MVGPAVQRDAVAHLQAVMGLSERRACSLVGADRKMVRYRSRRPHSALGYLTPAAYAANFTATDDRLRNPDQLRRTSVAPIAPQGVKPAEALIAAG
jgi:hypothetical protein